MTAKRQKLKVRNFDGLSSSRSGDTEEKPYWLGLTGKILFFSFIGQSSRIKISEWAETGISYSGYAVSSNLRNALNNTIFVMTILAISENQSQNFNFYKTTFCISVGQNSRTMVSKKKQQIVLSLDFSVSIIFSHTKNS